MSSSHHASSRNRWHLVLASLAIVVTASFLLPPGISCSYHHVEGRWSSSRGKTHLDIHELDEAQRESLQAPSSVLLPALTGPLGEKVNAALGGSPPVESWREGAAWVRVEGHLEGGGLSCYAPLFKRETFAGFISLRTAYSSKVSPGGPTISSMADSQLTYTIERTAMGLSSCAALETAAVDEIVAQIQRASAKMLAP